MRDRRLEPHPDALLPYGKRTCARLNKTGKRCARNGWVVSAPPRETCQLRELCSWRAIYAAAAASEPPAGEILSAWHRWGQGRSATEIFEHFLRRLARRETSAPMLPCLCPTAARFVFFRLALDQLVAPPPPLVQPAAAEGGGGRCCATSFASACTLVTQQTSWCSGIATETECHRSRTEGRPCVWVGSRCTKGHLSAAAGEPSCPIPAAAANAVFSHFDARFAGAAPKHAVDVAQVAATLKARVAYFHGGAAAEADNAVTYGPLVSSFGPAHSVPRLQCRRDLAACLDNLTRVLRVQLGGGREALPNDAL